MSIAGRDPDQAPEAKKYASPIPSRQFITNLRHEHGTPLLFNDLTDALALPEPYQLDEAGRRPDAERLLQKVRARIQHVFDDQPTRQGSILVRTKRKVRATARTGCIHPERDRVRRRPDGAACRGHPGHTCDVHAHSHAGVDR